VFTKWLAGMSLFCADQLQKLLSLLDSKHDFV